MKTLVDGTFGKYEINRLLGKGGMGEVYEAYDTDKGRRVALKLLPDQYADDERFRARFLRESRAAAILQEPHVIPIHDWGEIDHTLYIDMRLVDGQTLHEMVKSGPLEPQRATDIIRQIAAALDAAHAEDLIHRDVKPQNIILTPDDFAYLVDFGIAEARGDTHLTMVGYQVGSWDYMAPERFGDEASTHAVDIYSLACVFYEALTGHTPFPGKSEHVIAGHLSSPPPRPSAVNPLVPAAIDDVIARGMAKHPDDRYGSAGALARAATRALSTETSGPHTAPTMQAPRYGGAPTSPPPYLQFDYPPTGPGFMVAPQDRGERSRWLLPAVITIPLVVLVAVLGVTIGVLANRKSDSDNLPPAIAYPTSGLPVYEPTYQTPQPTYQTPAPSTAWSVPAPSTATAVVQDPEQQLRQIASGDRSFVSAQLADRWVPQLSSKRPGIKDNGVTWDNAMTLQEHLQLRQRYGARLLWSGNWSTFSDGNFWISVAGITFPDSAGALAWCRSQGFDRDHCAAKIVSTTHSIAGSTAYN